MKSGIYRIFSCATNEVYIGSSKNFKKRFTQHKSNCQHHRHCNKKLQAIHDKYGWKNFIMEVIEECEEDKLQEREKFHLSQIDNKINLKFKRKVTYQDTKKDLLSVQEFAILVSMHPNTIRRSIKNGRISAFKIGSGNRSDYRIPRSEIERMSIVDLEKIIERIVDERSKKDCI